MADTIIYTTNVADDRFETELTLRRDGYGILRVGSNRDQRKRPVGIFEAAVPQELIQQISAKVSTQGFLAAPSQDSLIPDESFREIKIVGADKQQKVIKMIGEQLAAPAPFIAAEQDIKAIINYLMQHPVVAVTLQVSRFPDQAKATVGTPPVEIIVHNIGRTPLQLESPRQWGQGMTQGEIVATRADIPVAQLSNRDQVFVEITGALISKINAPETGPLIPFGAGQKLAVSLQVPFEWPPGKYHVVIDLALVLRSQDGASQINVGLVAETQTVTIIN